MTLLCERQRVISSLSTGISVQLSSIGGIRALFAVIIIINVLKSTLKIKVSVHA